MLSYRLQHFDDVISGLNQWLNFIAIFQHENTFHNAGHIRLIIQISILHFY